MTDKLHFDDPIKITAPFGLLDDDTQARLRAWPHGVEKFNGLGGWLHIPDPLFALGVTYRARPAPLVPDYVDWSHVGPAVGYIARDASGSVFGYEFRPKPHDELWASPDGGIVARADRIFASYRRGTTPWNDSLISRPEVKE